MKSGKLVVLAIVALVLIGVAVWTSHRPAPGRTPVSEEGSPVLKALQDVDRLNSVAEILFKKPTGERWRFVREEGKWKAADRYGYPADFEKISNFLLALRRLKMGRRMPDDPISLARFGLAAVEEGEEKGAIEVEMRNTEGKEVATLRVGKERYRPRPGGEDSWGGIPEGRYLWAEGRAVLVMDPLSEMPVSVRDWLVTEVANVASYDIRSIEVADGEGRKLLLRRPEASGALSVPDLAPEEEMDSSKVNSLANALSWLHFEDVADPAVTDEAMGFDRPTVAVMTLTNGVVYTLTMGEQKEKGGGRYIRVHASYSPLGDIGEGEGEGVKEAEQAKEEKKKEEKKRTDEVKAFNARHEGWTYVVSAYKMEAVSADRAQFVKPKPPPPEQEKAEKQEATLPLPAGEAEGHGEEAALAE